MRMGWGVAKQPVCIGEGAKNFRGSHLGELGVFCFVLFFMREEESLGRGKQDCRFVHLRQGCRWPHKATVVSLKE